MKSSGVGNVALALAGCALVASTYARAGETKEQIRFAAPQRILAGEALLGAGRLYPSPVLHDVDGDGHLDIVVGDLMGRVTVALRSASEKAVEFGPEKPFPDRDGKPLKFHNW